MSQVHDHVLIYRISMKQAPRAHVLVPYTLLYDLNDAYKTFFQTSK